MQNKKSSTPLYKLQWPWIQTASTTARCFSRPVRSCSEWFLGHEIILWKVFSQGRGEIIWKHTVEKSQTNTNQCKSTAARSERFSAAARSCSECQCGHGLLPSRLSWWPPSSPPCLSSIHLRYQIHLRYPMCGHGLLLSILSWWPPTRSPSSPPWLSSIHLRYPMFLIDALDTGIDRLVEPPDKH